MAVEGKDGESFLISSKTHLRERGAKVTRTVRYRKRFRWEFCTPARGRGGCFLSGEKVYRRQESVFICNCSVSDCDVDDDADDDEPDGGDGAACVALPSRGDAWGDTRGVRELSQVFQCFRLTRMLTDEQRSCCTLLMGINGAAFRSKSVQGLGGSCSL